MSKINLQELTLGQIAELAKMLNTGNCEVKTHDNDLTDSKPIPVIVCTDKRAVVFGYTKTPFNTTMTLTYARMCLYWSSDVGGVFGLADIGPTKGCKISATTPSVKLNDVTAVFEVTPNAEKAWCAAPVQGR